MLKRISYALVAVGTMLVLSLGAVSPASAEPAAPSGVSSSSSAVEPLLACSARWSQTMKIRASASAGSTAVGQLNANTWIDASCDATQGGSASGCGVSDVFWIKVSRSGVTGYISMVCLRDWQID